MHCGTSVRLYTELDALVVHSMDVKYPYVNDKTYFRTLGGIAENYPHQHLQRKQQ